MHYKYIIHMLHYRYTYARASRNKLYIDVFMRDRKVEPTGYQTDGR